MTPDTTSLSIGFDAKRAARNNTGLGNYSRFVISSLADEYPQNRYLLYTPKDSDNPRFRELLQKDVTLRLPDTPIGRRFGSWWRSVSGLSDQLRRDKVDLFHGLSNELPLDIARSGIPSVVTIHDLIYRRVLEDYSVIDRALYDYKYRHAAQNATRIIAISECTKADLVNDYFIDPDKIDVIYQGCHEIFYNPRESLDIERTLARYCINTPYIACVGTVQSRKNQLIAVKALLSLPKEINLVIVGRKSGPYANNIVNFINRHGLECRVKWIEGAPLTDLPAIYAGAECSVYPSRYEGFGIPVIESIAVGTPVVAATGSSLEEAGGEGALYIDLNHRERAEQLAAYCNDIISNPDLRETLVTAGREHIKRFDPSCFARATMETYQKALGSV